MGTTRMPGGRSVGRGRFARWCCALVAALQFALVAPAASAAGQDAAPGGGYALLDSAPLPGTGGRPAGRVVRCVCFSANDTITVLRTASAAPVSPELAEDGDFADALWLFDVGSRGTTQVAVRFHRDDGTLAADVHQDQDGDGDVAVERDPTPRVVEPGHPSVRLTALDGYWQRAGRLAPNFDLRVDERFLATFHGGLFLDRMANDGQSDVEVQVRGPRPGDPRSFDWRTVTTPVSETSGIFRTTLMVRERGNEPAYPPVFPWLPLGATYGPTEMAFPPGGPLAPVAPAGEARPQGIVKPYGTGFAPLQVDWNAGKLAYLGEFVASRASEDNWFTYSIERVEPGVLTEPNFEAPFGYYDLAADDDGLPELQIRADRMSPDDRYNPARLQWRGRPYQNVRYSWDQGNTQHWSYKLGLLGSHPIEDDVAFPGFTLRNIPYDRFPDWVVDRPWDLANFVAAEHPMWTSEGIYDGDFVRELRDGYYTGATTAQIDPREIVAIGFRMDYNWHYGAQPWLTFNPIDARLHLVRPDGGVWLVDRGGEIRYLNLDGDDAVDGWQRWDGGVLTAQLYRVPGGLLYADAGQTLYRRTEIGIPAETFRTLPPTDHAEWAALGDRLRAAQSAGDPGADLRAMFDRFPGETTTLAAGPVTDVRRADGGVRFALEADAPAAAALGALAGAPVAPGWATVGLSDRGWTVEPATFALPVVVAEVSPGPVRAGGTATVRVTVANPGTMDHGGLTLGLTATTPGGRTERITGGRDLAVEGGGTAVFAVPWAPAAAGDWTVGFRVERLAPSLWEEPVGIVAGEQVVRVEPAPGLTPERAARTAWVGQGPGWVMVPLGTLLLAGAVGALVLRAVARRRP